MFTYLLTYLTSTVQLNSVQDGIYALGKAHMRSTPSLGSFSPNFAFETVPVIRLIVNGDLTSTKTVRLISDGEK